MSYLPDYVSRVGRILVVDDLPDNLFLIQTVLEDSHYEVKLAKSGEEALAEVEKFKPDLILLDVMMPGMDGYEVTKRIRQKMQTKALPFIAILLITADERSSVVKGLDIGADDFIRKPFDVDELSARVRSLLRLKYSIDEQEQSIRQREDFVSWLTHDLRTPLVASDRMFTLFQNGAFGEISTEMQEAIDIMIRSNQNLLQIVNTVLEVYRHEAKCKVFNLAPCDLVAVINEVAEELKPLVMAQGLDLVVEVTHPPNTGVDQFSHPLTQVLGDRLELRRVLTNLVGNAIKFTESGSITIRLTGAYPPALAVSATSPLQSGVTLQVIDTGSGMSPNELATLFERFRQSKHRRSGSGLGLYLSRQIVESHKGTISAQSELGKGSTFTVRLPAHT
ncbi:MAG: hybrid sensor histidine kinase/response regulator [Scytolyngbya sp. HA4215-MV1]|nr:hybrid sensor histidine kinase/response regulator [Scytolyngbya sp. HA4215-MV1]